MRECMRIDWETSWALLKNSLDSWGENPQLMLFLRCLQETYREGQEDLHCVFIDLEKAYDIVPREELYWCMQGCAREVHQTGEGPVPSMRDCSEVCLRNKRTFCSGSWTPRRIRFQPFPVCHHDGFTDGKHQKRSTWQMMFADDVVLCAREKDVLELELEQWREALKKRGMKVPRAKTETSTCAWMERH